MASSSSVKKRTVKPAKSRSDRELIFGVLWEFDPAESV